MSLLGRSSAAGPESLASLLDEDASHYVVTMGGPGTHKIVPPGAPPARPPARPADPVIREGTGLGRRPALGPAPDRPPGFRGGRGGRDIF